MALVLALAMVEAGGFRSSWVRLVVGSLDVESFRLQCHWKREKEIVNVIPLGRT